MISEALARVTVLTQPLRPLIIEAPFFRLVAGRTAGNVILRVIGTGLAFLTAIVLARALGAQDYGVYVLCMTWAGLLSTTASLGTPTVVMRETARARAGGDHGTIRGLLTFAYPTVLVAGALAAMAVVVFVLTTRSNGSIELWHRTLILAALTIPLASAAAVTAGFQSGYERVIAAHIPGTVALPLVFLGLVLAAWLTGTVILDPERTLVLYLVALVASLALGLAILHALTGRRELPYLVQVRPAVHGRAWLSAGLLLMGNQLLVNAGTQIDILMLAWLGDRGDIGPYHAASRGGYLVTFIFGSMVAVLAPTFARLWSDGRHVELQVLVKQSGRAAFLVAFTVATGLLLSADWFLGLFGPEFRHARLPFMILIVGWLGVVALGPSHILLTMAGHERAALGIIGAGTAVNIVLNAFLIPVAGIVGAAVGTAVSVLFSSCGFVLVAQRCLGIVTPVLFIPSPQRVSR